MDATLINQGLFLMLYGMGGVFLFLTILIYATSWMSVLVQRWFPEKIPLAPVRTTSTKTMTGEGVSPLTLKIIQAAVQQHRRRAP